MTRNQLTNWEPFKPFSVGFDNLFDDFDRMLHFNTSSLSHYPPYNIRKVNDSDYVIELAVAGFGKKDIKVKSQENTLTISSAKDEQDVLDKDESVLHRGISKRSFTRSFTIADDVVVKGADLKDGLLSVQLERIIPDEKKPKFIDIK
jgi:molecular chaperone IbpA|tara:strand:- start:40 stop:480 length:441 start_codon:yes stop_codon:yes gene_type:complete